VVGRYGGQTRVSADRFPAIASGGRDLAPAISAKPRARACLLLMSQAWLASTAGSAGVDLDLDDSRRVRPAERSAMPLNSGVR